SVTAIKVVLDPETVSTRTPVYFDLDPSRLVVARGEESRFLKDRSDAPRAFELGLRAQLEMQTLVTAPLAINLDFTPCTPIKFSGQPDKYPEFPTIPSTMSALGKGLEDVNLAELAKEAQEVLQGISRLVNGPDLKATLASANSALESAKHLMASGETNISKL